jgi:hypothetical protein
MGGFDPIAARGLDDRRIRHDFASHKKGQDSGIKAAGARRRLIRPLPISAIRADPPGGQSLSRVPSFP